MSSTPHDAAAYVRFVASSQENSSSSMTRGGYRGPDASPPPTIIGPGLSPCSLTKELDATMTAASPSALRAHSKSVVTEATGFDSNTSFRVCAFLVRANGCLRQEAGQVLEAAGTEAKPTNPLSRARRSSRQASPQTTRGPAPEKGPTRYSSQSLVCTAFLLISTMTDTTNIESAYRPCILE